jgi:hypothetical protein
MPMNTPAAFDVGMSASNRCFRRSLRLPHRNTTAATGLSQIHQGIVLETEFHCRDLQSAPIQATHRSPINIARHAPHLSIRDHPRNAR